ncbi:MULTISPECIES: hypothetical protein [unclassified Novosphingobium]|uniref:hypothetical protein n=1 Tax=unclassified Novosphingobium TaxID=2644732 RepID=UPI000D43FE42|nr:MULTISPECIES: hypothetical protein [unclassified Novosphingobium]PTR12609.1 hypothetical protein C8K11_10262 [Novosphingobium sp. GV055]PUB06393.1 hypothetical protein C8K12_10262 [Novosphingobium sp. GV061]PUB22444.1 hypothetical protein C8K14_10262 [Novosphingobium sp. GV079]PUB44469.1 hypothetical protein C8K10_10262 [Novosphingobium sp. GV027]
MSRAAHFALPGLAAVIACALAGAACAQTVEDRARAAASAAQAKTSDSDALQQNYLTPGLAGNAVTTVDGSKSFIPSIACQKTATMLELLAQPSATGDIGMLTISRDSDLDGSFDQVLHVPRPISGVCANGVIACDPGTWNNCHDLRWSVGSDNVLKLDEVDQSQLAGCYCINNACGSNLAWGNLATVLKDLGGGVVGALTTADPRIGVAEAAIDGPVIRYTGAQTTACTSNPSVTATTYASNPSALSGDAYAASQASSVFQMLAGSPAGLGKTASSRDCAITRNLTLTSVAASDVIQRTAGGYATYDDGAGNVDFVMGSPSDNTLYGGACGFFDFRMTIHVEQPDRLKAVTLPTWFVDDWGQVRIDGTLISYGPGAWTGSGYPPGSCELGRTNYFYPNIDLMPWMTKGDHEIWLHVAVGDHGEAYLQVHAEVDTSCRLTETLTDGCMGNAADPTCTLQNETVDGVETFRGGVATGLKPLAQSRIVSSATCSQTVTRDFFERDRRYQCVASTTTPDLSRGGYIIDHSTETLLADRTTAADGTVTTTTSPFALPDRGTVPSCEAICKTRAPKTNADAALDGVVGAKQNNPSGYDTFYHTCTSNGAGVNTCPLGAGEELVTDCGCLDDFPEAVVMMQTVRLGGADLVCTATQR